VTETLDLTDIQGLVARGYADLPFAAYLVLTVADATAARDGLGRVADIVTSAARPPSGTATNVALTAAGIERIAPGIAGCEGFSDQFVGGMVDPHRSRILGDVDEDDPGTWRWGGPGSDPVHALVLAFGRTPADLATHVTRLQGDVLGPGFRVVRRLDTTQLSEREHFGFHDGISQPILDGLPRAADGGDVVRAGEFVLGYRNEYGQLTTRPVLPSAADPSALLPRDPEGSGGADLGRNGSYLVFRQLEQDVDGFWSYVERAVSASGDSDGRELLAAKMVGRWPSGAPLVFAPDHDEPVYANANDFSYHDTDPLGLACPIGSHIRRVNPRDALDPHPGSAQSRQVNRRHRLLRRGRNYTEPAANGSGGARGLHFICLNANLARQYEFVQHSWINDPSFNGLHDGPDPLVGGSHRAGATFTVPAQPVRRRYTDLPRFVRVRGGAYFFLPGIRAVRYLATSARLTEGSGPT
jgi:Dyp-type peroxidase family